MALTRHGIRQANRVAARATWPRKAHPHGDRFQLRIELGEAILVRLVAVPEAKFSHPVVERRPDSVREQDEADVEVIEGRVAPGLVVGLHTREAKSIPGRDCPPIQFHCPEPQPSVGQSPRREVTMKRRPSAAEGVRLVISPACVVQSDQCVHVGLELDRILCQPVHESVFTGDSALSPAHLLAEVAAA